jgi:hypothetical protein
VPETGQLPRFWLSALLAEAIVPWHNFNLVGLLAIELESNLAIAGREFVSPRAPGYSQSKVRDETSAVYCGIACETWNSV